MTVMKVYPELALIMLLIGARRIAYYKNGFFVALPKWLMVSLFIVPFKSKIINISALVWQIPADILIILYALHLFGVDVLSNFTDIWSTLVIVFLFGVGGLILIYCVIFEIIAKVKNRR